jgi:hypothetical protein
MVPAEGFDSEGLLADSRLQNLEGRHVLLIKGSGGREQLAKSLANAARSSNLRRVYERVPAAPSATELAELERHFAADSIQVITATSPKSVRACCAWQPPAARGLRARALARTERARRREPRRTRASSAADRSRICRRSGFGGGAGTLAVERVGRIVEGIEK